MVHRSHEFHKLQRRCDSKRKGVARNCHSAASRLQIRHSCVRWRSDNESHENNFPQKAFCLRRADKLRLIDSQSGWGSVRSLDQWTPSRYQAGRLNITDRESCRSLRGSETGPSEDCFRFFLPPPPPRSLVRLWPASPIRVGEGSHVGWCCKSCTARHDRVLRVSERPRRRAIVWRCFASYNWQLSTGDHDAYQSVGWSSNYSAVQSECGRFRQRWVKFIGAPRHASFIDAMLRGQAVTPSGKMQVGLILIMLSVAIALTDAASIGHARGKADCKRWVKGKRGRCATPILLHVSSAVGTRFRGSFEHAAPSSWPRNFGFFFLPSGPDFYFRIQSWEQTEGSFNHVWVLLAFRFVFEVWLTWIGWKHGNCIVHVGRTYLWWYSILSLSARSSVWYISQLLRIKGYCFQALTFKS